MTVGERIQSARKSAGMKQSELAGKLGVAVITIGQYERGKRQPSFENLQRISDILDVSILYFTGIEAAKEDSKKTNSKQKLSLGGAKEETMNQDNTAPALLTPEQRGFPPEQTPPGYPPVWYGWPVAWPGAVPAYAPTPPTQPEMPGGVPKLAYSVEEAAEALGVSRSLVYRLIHQRGFPSVKLRGRRVISAELLAEWMRTQAGGC